MNKHRITVALFIIMLAGLFWSRALLSLSQGAWTLYAIWQYKTWWTFYKKDTLLIWSICPLALFFLGCYQQPSALANYDFLLTLSVYPIAAISIRCLQENTLKKLISVWQWAVIIGLLYPLGWYLFHMQQMYTAYGSGQSMPTFMDTDHIRFSMFLCAGLLFVWLYQPLEKSFVKLVIIGLVLCIIFLSVRTAWLILLIMFLTGVVQSFRSADPRSVYKAGLLFLLFVGISVAAYYVFPTVQQKIAYMVYDWQQFTPKNFQPNFSDGVRRIVNQAALHSIQSGKSNVGWAGIPKTLDQSFKLQFPNTILQYGRPFNQWLFWWMGSGWWGMLLFTIWLCYPFYWGWKNSAKGLVYWTAAILMSCLVESNLTFQFGVFLHAWPLALMWEEGKRELKMKSQK